MLLIGHDSLEAAEKSAELLLQMGRAAVRILADCVEHQELKRQTLAKSTQQLESAGFVFIRDVGTVWEHQYVITPSLTGEEALELAEQLAKN